MQTELKFIRHLQAYAQGLISNAIAARVDLEKLETSPFAVVGLLPSINEISRQVEVHRIASQQVWNLLEARRLQLQGAMDDEAIQQLERIVAGARDPEAPEFWPMDKNGPIPGDPGHADTSYGMYDGLILVERYTPSDSSPTEKLTA